MQLNTINRHKTKAVVVVGFGLINAKEEVSPEEGCQNKGDDCRSARDSRLSRRHKMMKMMMIGWMTKTGGQPSKEQKENKKVYSSPKKGRYGFRFSGHGSLFLFFDLYSVGRSEDQERGIGHFG